MVRLSLVSCFVVCLFLGVGELQASRTLSDLMSNWVLGQEVASEAPVTRGRLARQSLDLFYRSRTETWSFEDIDFTPPGFFNAPSLDFEFQDFGFSYATYNESGLNVEASLAYVGFDGAGFATGSGSGFRTDLGGSFPIPVGAQMERVSFYVSPGAELGAQLISGTDPQGDITLLGLNLRAFVDFTAEYNPGEGEGGVGFVGSARAYIDYASHDLEYGTLGVTQTWSNDSVFGVALAGTLVYEKYRFGFDVKFGQQSSYGLRVGMAF